MTSTQRFSSQSFSTLLLEWWDTHGRKDLPWQQNPTPYRVWISEIMLQQTQVTTVIPYYERFMNSFPTLQALAEAPIDQVLHHWTGLGYYARARNIAKTAQVCRTLHAGVLPQNAEALEALPGIGRSTAAAILSLACGQSAAILDGNVKRVLARRFGETEWPGKLVAQKRLWELSIQHTPKARCADYNQAMMDFGATFCTRSKPQCTACPFVSDCVAYTQNLVATIPGKKPKKAVPTFTVAMAIIRDQHQNLYLEQRPNEGIWGSLYSFPEYADLATLQSTYSNLPKSAEIKTSTVVTHKFTHRTLLITPVFLQLANDRPTIDAINGYWVKPHHALSQLGLPAPIKRLIQSLQDNP